MDTAVSMLPVISFYATDLIGVILPPVIQMLNYNVEDENRRFLISFLVCLVAAFFIKYPQLSSGNPEAVVTSFGVIFAESQLVYKLYFKNSKLRATMVERLEKEPEPVEGIG